MISVIREEDVFSLQTAILDAALAKTAPGQTYLSLSALRQLVGQGFDAEALQEMLRELVAEGILALGPPAGGDNQYCVTKEYLASLGK